ncbi:MAG: polysaccharide deacetylase family protein [Bacteroidota bacterium]
MLSVSNYHYIREDYSANYPSVFGVTPAGFQNQLKELSNIGDFVTINDLQNNYNDIISSKDNFYLITFDDGLKEQFTYALPILDSLNIPAVFFANSINLLENKVSNVHKIHILRANLAPEILLNNLLDNELNIKKSDVLKAKSIYKYDEEKSAVLKFFLNYKMQPDLREEKIDLLFASFFDEKEVNEQLYFDKKEICLLADLGYLGSHSHSHFALANLNDTQLEFELFKTKQYFEEITKKEIFSIAYPYGTKEAVDERVAKMAKKVGYKMGFTTTSGVNANDEDLLLLNRFDCNDLIGGKNYKQ